MSPDPAAYVAGQFLLGKRHGIVWWFSWLAGAFQVFPGSLVIGMVSYKKSEVTDNQLIAQCQICHLEEIISKERLIFLCFKRGIPVFWHWFSNKKTGVSQLLGTMLSGAVHPSKVKTRKKNVF
jgi:hypothetical protein